MKIILKNMCSYEHASENPIFVISNFFFSPRNSGEHLHVTYGNTG